MIRNKFAREALAVRVKNQQVIQEHSFTTIKIKINVIIANKSFFFLDIHFYYSLIKLSLKTFSAISCLLFHRFVRFMTLF